MALVFLVAVGALLLAWRLHVRLTELETTTREDRQTLRTLISDLEREVISLKKRLAALEAAPVEPRPAAAPPPSPPLIEAKAAPATAADREPARVPPPPAVRPAEQPAPPAVPPRIPAHPIAPPRGLAAPPAVPPPPRPAPTPGMPSPPPLSLAPTPPAPQAPPAAAWSFDWESLVGVKLFSWIAGIALVVAGLFFLRYSIEQGWLQPPVRMAIGIFVSLALLAVCELKAARAYPVTANALDAAAVALLFSTFYAAYVLWSLIGVPLAFVLLALVAVVAVLLSIRRNSLFIALLGLVGGFATPALVSTGQDNPIGLFGYLLILNAGLSWVAYRKTWPLLVGLSLVFTTLYEWSWVMTFLTDAKLPLAVGIFLVFPVLNILALTLGQPKPAGDQPRSLYGQLASASACLPLLFALYLAAAPAYAAHYGLLFAFLLVLDVGLFAIAITRGPELLHLIGGSATLIILWAWLNAAYGAGQPVAAWPAMLAVVALFVAFYLTAPVVARRLGRGLTGIGSYGALIAPLLLSAFPVFASLEPRAADPAPLFLVLFGLLVAIAWAAIVTRRGALHFIAAFFALATEAVWSTLHLTPERLLAALALYGVFGLFYLVVPLIARRAGRPFEPEGAAGGLLLVSLALLFFLGGHGVAPSSLWGLALLLAILNFALLIEGFSSRLPLIAVAGSILSWLVLASWWATAPVGAMLGPAVLVVGGFALLTLGGQIWLARRGDAASDAPPRSALFLGLVGHLFLFFVASQPQLSVPPWPMLGVLAVLDLAIGAAALYVRRGALFLAALAASQAILIVWVPVAPGAPWLVVGALAAGVVVALGCVWAVLVRRISIETRLFDAAAVTAAILAQLVTLLVAAQYG
ncbi:MAG: DUF2339 domain-containing protein, partial [Acidobacteria bacterium]|nr:DUF2339 domain-containing protein [Acidobacteriota bacterium]